MRYPVELRCCLDGCGGRLIAKVKQVRGGAIVLERVERYPLRGATLTVEEQQALTGDGDLVDLVRRKGGRWEVAAERMRGTAPPHASKVQAGRQLIITCKRHGDIAVAGRWLLEAFAEHERARRRVTLTIT